MTDKQPKALWLADMLEKGFRVDGPDSEAAAELRRLHALCARAMVEPDMAEVERLVSEHEYKLECYHSGIVWAGETKATRTALLDYVRGVMAERDVQIAECGGLEEEEDLLAAYYAGGESGYRRGLAERDALIADNERLSGLYEQAVKGRAPAPTACRTGMENEMTKEIEVIDQYNARHRFPVEGHYYEWRLKPGTIDVEGTDFLDVFRRYKDDEDEFEVIATFPRPARVGIVTDATCLVLPMRELQMEQCPRCGYVTRPTAEKLK